MASRLLLSAIMLLSIFALTNCKSDHNAVPKASGKTGKTYGEDPLDTMNAEVFSPIRFDGQEADPGLVFVEGGTFYMGQSEEDYQKTWDAQARQVTVHSFYMDEAEVANVDWKEFLHYIKNNPGANIEPSDPNNDTTEYGPEYAELMRPDVTVWHRELAYNEPFIEYYFDHPAFQMYPVVGINWYQANEYCRWRSNEVYKTKLEDNPQATLYKNTRYRLPTEAEWEYAARGLLEQEVYPWEGKSLRNRDGRFMANYKRGRGDFAGRSDKGGSRLEEGLNDGYMIPGPVKANLYSVNDFGLYNMAGNVAEWTMDVYRVLAYQDVEDFQPYRRKGDIPDDLMISDNDYGDNVDDSDVGRLSLIWNPEGSRGGEVFAPSDPGLDKWDRIRVYRGGAWSDVAYYLSCGTRRQFYADSSASHIGFRCAMTRVGSPSEEY